MDGGIITFARLPRKLHDHGFHVVQGLHWHQVLPNPKQLQVIEVRLLRLGVAHHLQNNGGGGGGKYV